MDGVVPSATVIGLGTESDGTMNEDTPVVIASAAKEVVTPSVVDMTVEKEKRIPLEDTTIPGSFPPLSTPVTTTTGNTLVSLRSIRAISDRFANTAYGFFLGKRVAYPVVANYVRNTWGKYGLVRSMFSSSTGLFSFQFSSMEGLDDVLENGPCDDGCLFLFGAPSLMVELKDNIVVVMPRIRREGHYLCNVCVEYEWKPPRCATYKVFGHMHEECPKNTGAGEKVDWKQKPSHSSRGVPVGPKMGFKPQKEYRPVSKKPNASSCGNKKKGVEPTIEVSNSNPFDVLNSVDNDGEFGTNGWTTHLVNNGATSSGSSYNTDRTSINSEVELVFDETTNLRIPMSGKDGSDKVYDTNSLLEQWRDSYPDNDDYDPYDDDMYENTNLSEHLQSICDDLDITVRGRKKK
ncbi:hypothetical protein Tco_0402096 [Tanacetum coccineum]